MKFILEFFEVFWAPIIGFILFFIFLFALTWSSGHASQIVLERHGYYMTWWQATFIDAEELCGDQDLDIGIDGSVRK